MFDSYFVFRSVTGAQRGEQLLRQTGIPCRMQRSPRVIAPAGCAYAVTVRRPDASAAESLLSRSGLWFHGPHLRRADGSFEEMGK